MKMKKIKFSTDEPEKPEVINDKKQDIQEGLPDLITGPIETQTPNIRPSQDSGSNKQADRSDQNSGTPSKSKYRPKKPADLSWPNNTLIKNPRQYPDPQPKPHPVPTKMPNSFYSNSQRKERIENKYPKKATTATPFWDPNSNWRAPGMSTTKKTTKKRETWYTDSNWTPPKAATATPTIQTPARQTRSARRNINYKED